MLILLLAVFSGSAFQIYKIYVAARQTISAERARLLEQNRVPFEKKALTPHFSQKIRILQNTSDTRDFIKYKNSYYAATKRIFISARRTDSQSSKKAISQTEKINETQGKRKKAKVLSFKVGNGTQAFLKFSKKFRLLINLSAFLLLPFSFLLLPFYFTFAQSGVLIPTSENKPNPRIFSLAVMNVEITIDNQHATVKLAQIFDNHTTNAL